MIPAGFGRRIVGRREWVLRAGNILALPRDGYRNYSLSWNYFLRSDRWDMARLGKSSLCSCIRGGHGRGDHGGLLGILLGILDGAAERCRLSRKMFDAMAAGVDRTIGDSSWKSLAL